MQGVLVQIRTRVPATHILISRLSTVPDVSAHAVKVMVSLEVATAGRWEAPLIVSIRIMDLASPADLILDPASERLNLYHIGHG